MYLLTFKIDKILSFFIGSNILIVKYLLLINDQRIGIYPANRNWNRFAEPTSARIGIGIVCESRNLGIGIGLIFVKWEVLANYSPIP